jgi:8-oxo-dGTP pyrophosphatase MutT (NUDIX family)
MAKHGFRDNQFAALPWRIGEGGRREVMLLTSRETHRWIIPKGWPMKGRKPGDVASQEAYEEAGLIGHIVGKRPIGSFISKSNWPRRPVFVRCASSHSGWNASLMTGHRRRREKPNGLTRPRPQRW